MTVPVRILLSQICLLAGFSLLITSCAINSDTETANNLPNGWSRVQAREGYVAREYEQPLIGFTIDLPPNWSAGESWPHRTPTGWLTAPILEGEKYAPLLRYGIGGDFTDHLDDFLSDDRYIATSLTIEGSKATLVMPAEGFENSRGGIGIYFETIPGTPANIEPKSLAITGFGRRFDLQVLPHVLSSVRYQALPALPNLPTPRIVAGVDWIRVNARDDTTAGFSVMLPPDWKIEQSKGIDSLIGKFIGHGFEIHYDYGNVVGTFYDPESIATRSQYIPPHSIWEEEIEDRTFWFAQPRSGELGTEAITTVFTTESGSMPSSGKNLALLNVDLTTEQQDLALAIFRTIKFD